jgi:hypothetical protein
MPKVSSQTSRKMVLGACAVFAVLLIIIGLIAAIRYGIRQHLLADCNEHAQVSERTPVPDNSWGRWRCYDIDTTYPSTHASFAIGQTIIIPNYRSFQVDSIERNWQPSAGARLSGAGADDITNKEIIRIHVSVTNISTNTEGFNPDFFFALMRANEHEQRIAALNFDTPDKFVISGNFPWQQPGDTLSMAIPFLIDPGEQPRSFIFLWSELEPPSTPIARVVIDLHAPLSKGKVRFVPDQQFVVDQHVIY